MMRMIDEQRMPAPEVPGSKIFEPSGLISFNRQEALFDALLELGINIHDDEWSFAHLVKVKSHEGGHYTLRFEPHRNSRKYKEGLGWLKPFIKGFIADRLVSGASPN